jgi:hypothetical protein
MIFSLSERLRFNGYSLALAIDQLFNRKQVFGFKVIDCGLRNSLELMKPLVQMFMRVKQNVSFGFCLVQQARHFVSPNNEG